ncbi:DMT family transporter [Geomonas nitrogeniifigens]|uniref:DMT family transporter n=1 Tax=Geomonas diazotrophica TaxID=2843197 RepID=UPI001C2C0F64|nr:DMT family transporter [Geomonas nitrogeniifigens]QXE85521.1 DMT family transporter [Geomonas nitrogeniifigens]
MKNRIIKSFLFLTEKNINTYLACAGITFFISSLFHEQILSALGTPLSIGSAFLILTLSSVVTRPYGPEKRMAIVHAFNGASGKKFWGGTIILWSGSILLGFAVLFLLYLNILNISGARILYVWGLTFSLAATIVNILPKIEIAIDPVQQESTKSVLIIGPSVAGKTGSVACLAHAARQFTDNTRIRDVSIHPENPETARLFDKAISILRSGGDYPLEASHTITNYLFSLNCTNSKGVVHATTFEFIDGPGGAVFPDKAELSITGNEEECRDKIIEKAKTADGIILCLNVNDTKGKIDSIDSGLRHLFQQIRKHTQIKKFCIVFLQIDRYFLAEEQDAYARAVEADPSRIAQDHLTHFLLRDIKSNLPGTDIAVGIASTYGFIDKGQANFDISTGGFLFHGQQTDDPSVAFRLWEPFQVLDPYIYMATGELSSLRKL